MSIEITIPATLRACAASHERSGYRGQVYAQVNLHDGLIPSRVPLAVTIKQFWSIDDAIWAARDLLADMESAV